jgi:hypothetical protein
LEGVGRHLRLSRELPTFPEVRSALILEELTLDHSPSSTSTALLASGDRQPAGGRSSSSSRPPAKQQHQQQHSTSTRDSSGHGSSQKAPFDRRSPGSASQVVDAPTVASPGAGGP